MDLYRELTKSLSDFNPTPLTEDIVKKVRDINALDKNGDTLLHIIVQHNNIPLLQFVAGKRKDLNLNVTDKTQHCCTPLLRAIMNEDVEIGKLLVTLGADVNVCDRYKISPLHFVALQHDFGFFTTLLDHGANVHALNDLNYSVLHYAVRRRDKQVIYRLLRGGINVNCQNHEGRTAFYSSIIEENVEISCMLLYFEADPNLDYGRHIYSTIRYQEPETVTFLEVLCFSYRCIDDIVFLQLIVAVIENPLQLIDPHANQVINMLEKFSEVADIQLDGNINHRYYSSLFCFCVNVKEADNLRLIWLSLSLGLHCSEINIALQLLGYGKELLALIWGSCREAIHWRLHSSRGHLHEYWKFLHENVDSIRGNELLHSINTKIIAENRLRMFSFFTSDYDLISEVLTFNHLTNDFELRNGRLAPDTKTFKIKTLAELSRNASRVFVMKRFKTKTFYDVHEVLNNLDIPNRIKRFLQFRIPVNCRNCTVIWCNCDLGDVAKSIATASKMKI